MTIILQVGLLPLNQLLCIESEDRDDDGKCTMSNVFI